jgi:hypothetical protein
MNEEIDLWKIQEETIKFIKEGKEVNLQELEDFLIKKFDNDEKNMRKFISSLCKMGEIWIIVRAA